MMKRTLLLALLAACLVGPQPAGGGSEPSLTSVPSTSSPITGGSATEGSAGDELDQLRRLQPEIVHAIETSAPAFVFLEGGSGFLISPDGLVLTNDHVVAYRSDVVAQIAGGKSLRAKVLGHLPGGDLALLKLSGASDLPHLELGDSDALEVGQPVVALGDPFLLAAMNPFLGRAPPDYKPSASFGIVSALHRRSEAYPDAIQTDLAVNRGNSGGPLLTLDGKVVGINGKIETRFENAVNTGVGYAVPSSLIKNFLEALKGAGGGTVYPGTIRGMEVVERSEGKPGLPVRNVAPGSTAGKAGIREGDWIVAVNGKPAFTRSRFQGLLNSHPAGEEFTLTLTRGSENLELKVRTEPEGSPFLAINMEDAPVKDGSPGGAVLRQVMPGGPGAQAGLKMNDVVVSFGGAKIASAKDLREAMASRLVGEEVEVEIIREGKPLALKVRMGGRP